MELRYSITYSPSASRDLDGIHNYISEKFYSVERANKQVSRIVRAVKTLAVFPKMYRIRKKNKGVRICPVDSYLIIYSVDDEKHSVNISRIIYSRRNLDSMI